MMQECLQRKVQFDVCFYFARRGAENMEKDDKRTLLKLNLIRKVKPGMFDEGYQMN